MKTIEQDFGNLFQGYSIEISYFRSGIGFDYLIYDQDKICIARIYNIGGRYKIYPSFSLSFLMKKYNINDPYKINVFLKQVFLKHFGIQCSYN